MLVASCELSDGLHLAIYEESKVAHAERFCASPRHLYAPMNVGDGVFDSLSLERDSDRNNSDVRVRGFGFETLHLNDDTTQSLTTGLGDPRVASDYEEGTACALSLPSANHEYVAAEVLTCQHYIMRLDRQNPTCNASPVKYNGGRPRAAAAEVTGTFSPAFAEQRDMLDVGFRVVTPVLAKNKKRLKSSASHEASQACVEGE